MKKVAILPLLFGICLYCQAQELEFSIAANSKKAVTFNKKLKPLLNQKSIALLEDYFLKYKNDINDASVIVEYEGEFVKKAKRNKPLIHDVMDECIAGNYDTAMLSYIINKGANTAIDFFEWPPFYRALNFIATHKIEECKYAINVVYVFANSANYDIKKQYKTELPPFAYLLRKNFEFLGNKYNKDYLPVELVKLFIDKGSNANTYDQTGNNLITFTAQTNNVELQRYLAKKDVDINKTNETGKDAMYAAIVAEATESVKDLLQAGYKLEPSRLLEMGLQNKINKSNASLINCITDESYKYVSTYAQAKDFMLLFDESKRKLLENEKYLKIEVPYTKMPEFIAIMESNNTLFSEEESKIILNEKTKYINASGTIELFIKAVNTFPLIKLNNYVTNYFESEASTKLFYDEIKSITTTIAPDLKQNLLLQINSKSAKYYSTALENSKSVNNYISLAKNYPSRSTEVTVKCFNRYCNQSYFSDGGSNKWSEEIQYYLDEANLFINNANDYLGYFIYNNNTVSTNKSAAYAARDRANIKYNTAKDYESELIKNVDIIYENIKNTNIVPHYELTENKSDWEVKIAEYRVPSFSRTIGYNKSDNTYYTIGIIFTEGHYKSINELIKQDMFLNYWYAAVWTYKPNPDKFKKMEKIISEFKKYGIKEWYKMSL